MKKIVKDVLLGFLVIFVVIFFEFLVTIPFGEPAGDITRAEWASWINRELLVTALPAAFTTLGFTWLLKTQSRRDAIRRSIIWTCMIALNYMLMGLGNDNLDLIFGRPGVYVLLLCSFVGPLLFSKIKKLN